MEYYNSRGKTIKLGENIGRGGEGSVYEVEGMEGTVAKIYHNTIGADKVRKLKAMVNLKNKRLFKISAWPLDTLHSSKHGPLCGILMGTINGYKEIYKLYSPKGRLLEFPHGGWDFLIHAAANIARAFSVIHEQGHVIGDVNHGNVAVSRKGMVMLIDTDSYQICHGGKVFTCDVGVSTHQPPEIASLDTLKGVVRTPNHDNFGLAVIIFQLLFMGRHPFAGGVNGNGEMGLEKAIMEKRFAYSQYNSNSALPPGVLTLNEVSPEIASLFERAFVNDVRPTAQEWVTALDDLSHQLRICSYDKSHRYLRTLGKCPWCRIEKSTGAILFSPMAGWINNRKDLEVEAACSKIIDYPSLEPAPFISNYIPFKIMPASEYKQYSRYRRIYYGIIITIISWAIVVYTGYKINVSLAIITLFFVSSAAVLLPQHVPEEVLNKAERKYMEVYSSLEKALASRQQGDWEGEFIHRKNELMEVINKYKNLDDARAEKLKNLQLTRRKRQLIMYLRAFSISTARIPNVVSSCKRNLKSQGVENAADIDEAGLRKVQGLSSRTCVNLLKWRRMLEKNFVYNPHRGFEHQYIMEIEKEIFQERINLEKIILNGADELSAISHDVLSRRQKLNEEIKRLRQHLAQARANLWAMGRRIGR